MHKKPNETIKGIHTVLPFMSATISICCKGCKLIALLCYAVRTNLRRNSHARNDARKAHGCARNSALCDLKEEEV